MRIEYKENKTPFPDIPMYSTFIFENDCGEKFLCVKTGDFESVCIGKEIKRSFGPDNVVVPCEIEKVLVKEC